MAMSAAERAAAAAFVMGQIPLVKNNLHERRLFFQKKSRGGADPHHAGGSRTGGSDHDGPHNVKNTKIKVFVFFHSFMPYDAPRRRRTDHVKSPILFPGKGVYYIITKST